MKQKNKLQAIIVVALLAGGALYYLFGSKTSTSDSDIDPSDHQGGAVSRKPASPSMVDRRIVPMSARSKPRSEPIRSDPSDKAEIVFTAPWGSGPGQLGRQTPEEGAPEGPMSFVVDDKGRYLVLDQVNSRIQVFEPGESPRSIALSGSTFQDLVLDGAGNRLVLDRLGRASITRLDPEGNYLGEINLIGPDIPEGGMITGMFAQEDGIWVEIEHHRLVRVADADGNPDPDRPAVEGRFTADGGWLLTAALERLDGAAIFKQSTGGEARGQELMARVRFSDRVSHLLTLDSDTAGRVFLAAHLVALREVSPFDVVESRDEVVILAYDGTELGRHALPTAQGSAEQFRSIAVGPDGSISQLLLDENGATMRRWM